MYTYYKVNGLPTSYNGYPMYQTNLGNTLYILRYDIKQTQWQIVQIQTREGFCFCGFCFVFLCYFHVFQSVTHTHTHTHTHKTLKTKTKKKAQHKTDKRYNHSSILQFD